MDDSLALPSLRMTSPGTPFIHAGPGLKTYPAKWRAGQDPRKRCHSGLVMKGATKGSCEAKLASMLLGRCRRRDGQVMGART